MRNEDKPTSRIAKPAKPEYRRNLPHLITDEHPLFVTFRARQGIVLPEGSRQTVLRHCLYDHTRKYILHAAVVMPDHVHLVLTLCRDETENVFGLAEIMQAIKGASSHSVNKLMGRKGSFWQAESYDHVLRREESLDDTMLYVCMNPVRKGLVTRYEEYPWLWWEGKPSTGEKAV